jgi:hypothetical protein
MRLAQFIKADVPATATDGTLALTWGRARHFYPRKGPSKPKNDHFFGFFPLRISTHARSDPI